jgi:hypothetical protein
MADCHRSCIDNMQSIKAYLTVQIYLMISDKLRGAIILVAGGCIAGLIFRGYPDRI